MDKADKKRLKAQFKRGEQDALRASIPMGIDDLKDLLRVLDRESVPPCDHDLAETVAFLESRQLDPDEIVPWLQEHGGFCDCEVLANVYDAVGDIVGWHLDDET